MNTTITAAVAALIIGFGGGYLIAGDTTPIGAHVMSDGSTMSDTMAGMTAGLDGKTGDAFDKVFLQEMIVHHEGAVAMAELALTQAKHSELQELSRDIIAAQTEEIATMRTWLDSWYSMQQ